MKIRCLRTALTISLLTGLCMPVWAQAAQSAANASAENTNKSSELLKQAQAAQKAENHQLAIELLTQALASSKEPVRVLRLRAESWQYLGDYQKAEADLQAGLKLAPNHAELQAELLEGLGWLKLFQKDYSGSEQALHQALAQHPDHYWAKLNLAHALLLQNRHREALKTYCELAQTESDKPLGQLLAKDYQRLNAKGVFHLDYGLMLFRFGLKDTNCPQP